MVLCHPHPSLMEERRKLARLGAHLVQSAQCREDLDRRSSAHHLRAQEAGWWWSGREEAAWTVGGEQILKFPTSVYPKVRVWSGIQPFCMEVRAGEFGGTVSLFQSVAG